MHAYHHPERLRTSHQWVDWFIEFDAADEGKSFGLEFKEGLWAEKLAVVAILVTIAIIVVSVVWCLRLVGYLRLGGCVLAKQHYRGGDLQTWELSYAEFGISDVLVGYLQSWDSS